MIEIANRESIQFHQLVKKASQEKLWTSEDSYFNALLNEDEDYIHMIAVLTEEKVIGCSIIWTFPASYEFLSKNAGVYIKPQYRRMGYGTALIEAVNGKKYQHWAGETGSDKFWANIKNPPGRRVN